MNFRALIPGKRNNKRIRPRLFMTGVSRCPRPANLNVFTVGWRESVVPESRKCGFKFFQTFVGSVPTPATFMIS